jgi:DNA-binding NarL/FixJ family response regulator
MERNVETLRTAEPLNVLLIGNNPIDMGATLEKINQVKGRKIITEIAFDIRSAAERLMKFSPNFILIDDNIGKAEMALAVETLTKTRKTKNIPITVLKNSNYTQTTQTTAVLDYVLKQNFSTESLYTAIRNSLRLRRAQEFLYAAYKKRKGQLSRLAF